MCVQNLCIINLFIILKTNILFPIHLHLAIAEGGATGPTFRPEGMKSGFAVVGGENRGVEGLLYGHNP